MTPNESSRIYGGNNQGEKSVGFQLANFEEKFGLADFGFADFFLRI